MSALEGGGGTRYLRGKPIKNLVLLKTPIFVGTMKTIHKLYNSYEYTSQIHIDEYMCVRY